MKESSRRGVPLPGIAEPTKARPTGSGTIPEEGQSIVSSGNSARRPRRSVASAREGEALDSFLQNLTREAWAWQIYAGIVALLFVTAAGFLLTVGAVTGSVLIGVGGAGKSESRFLLAYAGILCGVLAAACVPAVVIGIIRGKRVAALAGTAPMDCTEALRHAMSIGNLVLAGFFSLPALVFALKNRAYVQKNKGRLEAVRNRQRKAGEGRG